MRGRMYGDCFLPVMIEVCVVSTAVKYLWRVPFVRIFWRKEAVCLLKHQCLSIIDWIMMVV